LQCTNKKATTAFITHVINTHNTQTHTNTQTTYANTNTGEETGGKQAAGICQRRLVYER